MRPIIGVVLGCVAALASAQSNQGSYKPGKAAAVPWSINAHSTLVWNSIPYLPIGIQVDASAASIQAAKAEGFHDVLVDLPVSGEGWSDAIPALEGAGMRYVIRISSLTPMAKGIAVDPAAYRVPEITGDRHLDLMVPGATGALVVVADKRDSSIIAWSHVPVDNGHLVYDVKPGPAPEAVVLVYPETVSLEQPDYWEGMDDQRDQLLLSLRRHPLGPGLRGFVDPLGKVLSLPGKDLRFVPSSAAFQLEFAQFLENRYRNVISALRAWALDSEVVATSEVGESKEAFHTFSEIASFVPLWSGTRGVPQIWDPIRKKIYPCDKGRSALWADYAEAIGDAEARRYARMVSAIREVADVPVVQDWAGWAAPYETEQPSVDGIGMRASGSSHSAILSTAARATSSMLRWKTPGWLPATEIDLSGGLAAAETGAVLDDLVSLGARGVFVRTSDPAVIKAVASEAARRASDTSPADYSPQALFYPENATNPAVTQRLPGGEWWLPCPADGNRIDLGNGFFGYRWTEKGKPMVALWTRAPSRVLLRMAAPDKATFRTCDGSDPQPKIVKRPGLGVEINLTQFPLLVSGVDEVPVPDPAYQLTSAEVAALLKQAEDQHLSFQEQQMQLTDAYKAFDRNPGGAYAQIRDVLHQLDNTMGDFSWTEAEASEVNTFSETVKSPGCSGGAALAIHSTLDAVGSYYADYEVPIHSKNDQELWIAARIPPEQRGFVSLRIASQTFLITGEPIGLYAGGFGWYRLGLTKLLGDDAKVRVTVVGQLPDIAIDAILLAPPSFTPDGVSYPEPLPTRPSIQKKEKGKRGGIGGLFGGG